MQHLSTAFLIFALVIAVHQDGVKAHAVELDESQDQIAEEGKHRAVTIVESPKYVAPPQQAANTTSKPEQIPPSKPPISPTPDKHNKPKYVELPRIYYGQIHNVPPHRQHYNNKPLKIQSNTAYKYQKVIPLHSIRGQNQPKHQQLIYAASTIKPSVISNKSPKFSLPVETVNGIRADFVRPPPHFFNTTTTTTTPVPTTTTKYIRNKRIWPKHVPNRANVTSSNSSVSSNKTSEDLSGSASQKIIKYVYANGGGVSSTAAPSTKGPYRRVTRVPKKKPTTPQPANYTRFEQNDWVPIIPSHYTINKVRKIKQTPILSRRSDVFHYNSPSFDYYANPTSVNNNYNKRMLFLQSFGLIPMESSQNPSVIGKKNIIVVGKSKKPLNVSGYRKKPVQTSHVIREYPFDAADPKIITRVKHHHHHHHHRYLKTVQKPFRVEVPKPVPVPVPMPVPVRVEQKVPYPVPVKVPHPVPVKVVEKEYVPKPYPVIQHVPVVKHVQVKVPQPYPVHVEKRVPYPVEVQVPVDKPYPVPVPVEKRVPVPVPVRVLVPQPYPVETKVPYPVQVKEPVEVIKHVPVRVPYPEPFPVKVPVRIPYPVERKVPYPIEIEKKVPVPYAVKVPQKVEVEKKVPVYIPKPMPFERKVPVPVKIPYPVRIPIRVPYGIPILVHPTPEDNQQQDIQNANLANNNNLVSHYAYSVNGDAVTQIPQNTVTAHGNGATSSVTVRGKPNFLGFQSRIDNFEDTTTSNPVTIPDTTTNPGILIIVPEPGTQSLSEETTTTSTTTKASR